MVSESATRRKSRAGVGSLESGRRVGWSFSPAEGRPNASGAYLGQVCGVHGIGMERHLTVRMGDTLVRMATGRAACFPGDSCRFDIDPAAIQVWPLE
jgi:hypothetical protein